MTEPLPLKRTVRSYVKRTGRMTPSQERALSELWSRYGIDYGAGILDLDKLFGRPADKILEIGFGNGDTLVQAAVDRPDIDFIGIEVHEPGVGHCLLQARNAGIPNLRVIVHDAMEVMAGQIGDHTLSRINLYFPDPWPKKRHHKRRIVNPPFLSLAAGKIRFGGTLNIATDWANYAEHIDEVMSECSEFVLAEQREHGGDKPLDRHTTKFERRGLKIGHRIQDRVYRRVDREDEA